MVKDPRIWKYVCRAKLCESDNVSVDNVCPSRQVNLRQVM